jgi:cytochrome P450
VVTARCPVAHDFDLLSPERLLDPYPTLRDLRDQSPVFYVPELDHYVVTRFADIEQILLDRDTFSASIASSPLRPVGARAQQILDEGGFHRTPTLNNADPPRHAPMRKAALRCLTPRRISMLEPEIVEIANSCIDDLECSRSADLVQRLSFPLPAQVTFALLGFPDTDIEMLKTWCRSRVLLTYGDLSPEDQAEGAEAVVAFWKYIQRFVEARLAEPADDTTSDLLAVHRESPDALTIEDIVNILYSLALAGHETTTNLITNGVRQLLLHREQWDKLCIEPSLVANAVEEALRFDGPVLVHRRRARVDTAIGGVPVPAEGRIMMIFAAANRDEREFANADDLDVERADAGLNLAFGKGAHYCLGAPLARLEMRTVLELLTKRLPDLDLVSGIEPVFVPNLHFRSISSLMVAPHGAEGPPGA